MILLLIVVGAVLAVPFILFARRFGGEPIFALGLAVAAGAYVGFVFWGDVAGRARTLELVGGVIFVVLAVLGRRSPGILAAGWGAHAVWDLAFHPPAMEGYWPYWYPAICLGFDLVVAAHLGRVARARVADSGVA